MLCRPHQHSAGSQVDVFVDTVSERSADGQVRRVLSAWRSPRGARGCSSFVFAYEDADGQLYERAPGSTAWTESAEDPAYMRILDDGRANLPSEDTPPAE